jgi:hypothetical protein
MAERLAFYFRGPSPGPGFSETFYEGLKAVLDLPVETLQRIGDELSHYQGFLSAKSQNDIISNCLHDKEPHLSLRLGDLVRVGERFLRENRGGLVGFMSQLERWQESADHRQTEGLTDDQLAQLKDRLPFLIKEYPSRLRQWKADRLAEATGLRAESVDLICDLRPVLDEGRSKIIGVIPITTLKIVASGVDRFPIAFEAILSA